MEAPAPILSYEVRTTQDRNVVWDCVQPTGWDSWDKTIKNVRSVSSGKAQCFRFSYTDGQESRTYKIVSEESDRTSPAWRMDLVSSYATDASEATRERFEVAAEGDGWVSIRYTLLSHCARRAPTNWATGCFAASAQRRARAAELRSMANKRGMLVAHLAMGRENSIVSACGRQQSI